MSRGDPCTPMGGVRFGVVTFQGVLFLELYKKTFYWNFAPTQFPSFCRDPKAKKCRTYVSLVVADADLARLGLELISMRKGTSSSSDESPSESESDSREDKRDEESVSSADNPARVTSSSWQFQGKLQLQCGIHFPIGNHCQRLGVVVVVPPHRTEH